MKKQIQTNNAPKPAGPYSQGVSIDGFLFVSGQDGVTLEGKKVSESIEAQTTACLQNVENILKEAGATMEDIVHMTCHIHGLTEKKVHAFNQAFAAYFENIDIKPARITVGSTLLETDVEITAIAFKKKLT